MAEKKRQNEFLDVLERHKKLIYKVSYLYCDNPVDRKDLFQEILINLWDAWPRYEGRAKISSWMYRIALNTAVSWFRKSEKTTANLQFTNLVPELKAGTDSDALLEELYNAINVLGKMDKAIMLLVLDGCAQATIAEIMGMSKTNVATKIARIKQKLREYVSNH